MQNELTPAISVITPSFNSVKYIEYAIQSVLSQGYENVEHIIVDGGSTDGTVEVLKKHPHLKWISEPDRGQSDAMNKGFKMSKGDIIVYLNADDFFEPGAFYNVVKYFAGNSKISFLVGECNVIDEEGRYIPGSENPSLKFYEILQWWKHFFPVNPSAYFYRRQVQEKVGPFDEASHYSMDYDFLLRASRHYDFFKINETLGNYRYIKGTKTFESNSTDHWKKQLVFSRKYWKYLTRKQKVSIRLSYYRFQLNQLGLVKNIKYLYHRGYRVMGRIKHKCLAMIGYNRHARAEKDGMKRLNGE
jgi:glycosyltransferase involved in cell wall biosynthesis